MCASVRSVRASLLSETQSFHAQFEQLEKGAWTMRECEQTQLRRLPAEREKRDSGQTNQERRGEPRTLNRSLESAITGTQLQK
jgi:hypothetical protein